MRKEYKEFLESEVKDVMREVITERINFEINGILDQLFNKNNNSDELAEKIKFLENQNKDLLNELEAEKEAHKKQLEELENKMMPAESGEGIKKDETKHVKEEKDINSTELFNGILEEEHFETTKKEFSGNTETVEENNVTKTDLSKEPAKEPNEERDKVFMDLGDRKLAAVEAKKIKFNDFKNSYDILPCLANADLAKKYKALVMKLKDSYFDVDRVLLNSVICELLGIKKSMLLEISKELFDENIIEEQLQYKNEKDVNLIFALYLHRAKIKSEDLNKRLNEKLAKTGYVYSNKNYLPFITD